MAQLVTVYASVSLSEIYIAQATLQEGGVPSFTRDERLHQTAPYISLLSNGIQLQVAADDLDQAVQILQQADILVPRVEKKDNFTKWLKGIFIVVLILELVYLLFKNNVI